jgi:hypothetical protein
MWSTEQKRPTATLCFAGTATILRSSATERSLMDTSNGESERMLVQAALKLATGRRTLAIGGLGVGFSLEAAMDQPGVEDGSWSFTRK